MPRVERGDASRVSQKSVVDVPFPGALTMYIWADHVHVSSIFLHQSNVATGSTGKRLQHSCRYRTCTVLSSVVPEQHSAQHRASHFQDLDDPFSNITCYRAGSTAAHFSASLGEFEFLTLQGARHAAVLGFRLTFSVCLGLMQDGWEYISIKSFVG